MSVPQAAADPRPGSRLGQHAPRPAPRAAHLLTALRVVLVRLRFLLALLGLLLLVGYWPTVRNYWDKLTRPASLTREPVSPDTEYWCPMCPGVVSQWPSKCPVCNMALVRRKKGEAVPLPDGVVARMQFAPYRVQLAGIRTYPAEYRRLVYEVTLAGFVAPAASETSGVSLLVEVPEKDVAVVAPGTPVEAVSEAFPGQVFAGKVGQLAPQLSPRTRTLRVRLDIDDPRRELLPGMRATARLRVPVARLGWALRTWADEWRNRTLVDLLAHARLAPTGPAPAAGTGPLLRLAIQQALLCQELVLAVPESAVIDTGITKVVYVEKMPGLFDGLEVVLGRRCGEFYPVLRGVEAGDRIVTAGAFLLDAETRLNPSVAASYFGAGRTPGAPTNDVAVRGHTAGPLTTADQALAARQKVCPVTDEPLDSMGGPVKLVVHGRTVFVCCKACAPALRKDPQKYLMKLPRPEERP